MIRDSDSPLLMLDLVCQGGAAGDLYLMSLNCTSGGYFGNIALRLVNEAVIDTWIELEIVG